MIRALTVLLLALSLSGLPGVAGVLAAAPAGSHPHCCCAPEGSGPARCDTAVDDAGCGCEVAPAPAPPARPSGFPAPSAPSASPMGIDQAPVTLVVAAPATPPDLALYEAGVPVRRTGDTPSWLVVRSLRR